MHPVLFEIFGFKVHSFGLLMLVAFVTALWFARSRARRFGFEPDEVSDIAFWALIAGVLGARIAFIVQEIPFYSQHPEKLLSLQFEGLTSFGGLIFGFLAIVVGCWRRKKPVLAFLDLAGGPMLVGHAIGRVGCLLNGCCYGGVCDLPWAISIEGLPGLYHPAQIYDSFMNLAGLAVLLLVERRGLVRGRSFGVFLVVHGLARFVYEFWRAGTTSTTIGRSPLTEGHVAALVLVVLGIAVLVRARKPVPAGEPTA
ncbi:MAG: prolipoprotein diacylglyceryl transferase [Fimbriimonadaceae bacterium]|nr:prolipoprotein diacylglyceryl transferase [Fimbriimonadaceae bacterium]